MELVRLTVHLLAANDEPHANSSTWVASAETAHFTWRSVGKKTPACAGPVSVHG
jgi:hypothetical protein